MKLNNLHLHRSEEIVVQHLIWNIYMEIQGLNPDYSNNKKLWTQVFIALLLDIDVRPGNETAGKYSHGALCNLLDNHLPRHPPGRSGETYGGQDLAANAAERDRKANRCSCSYQILG